jgi:hypothetical protein
MKNLIVLAASRLLPGRSPMKTTRRFAVATLLVLAVAVVLGAPAPASAGKVKGTQITLYPTADSPSRNATGTVTLLYPLGSGPIIYFGAVSVSVSKLAPNASYYMPVTVYSTGGWSYGTYVANVPIQTDARGNGGGRFSIPGYYGYIWNASFQVYDSSGTLVLTPNR